MKYKQYRYFDLAFFTFLGVVSTLFSEGLFVVFENANIRLSLIMLIGLIASIRWGKLGIIPYGLSMLTMIFFENRSENLMYFIPYYLLMSVAFTSTIFLMKKTYKQFYHSMSKTYLVFILAFLAQMIVGSLFSTIFESNGFIDMLILHISSQLLNLVIVSILMLVLYKFSKLLFNDMNEYLQNVQEEKNEY